MGVPPVTCHILDTTCGRPASNVKCEISYQDGANIDNVQPFAYSYTNSDGRVAGWTRTGLGAAEFVTEDNEWTHFVGGSYRIRFHTKDYFSARDGVTFFPFVDIWFQVPQVPDKHYHVPLLLSNYGYSTYRGS